MTRSLLAGLLVATMALPAFAAAPDAPATAITAPAPSAPRDPWAAVGLSAAGPIVLSVATLTLGPTNPTAVPAMAALLPLGLSAGYVYANDPKRGVGVALGGYAVAGVSALAMTGLILATSSGQGAGFALGILPATAAVVGGALYTPWALADVHQTTVRLNGGPRP
jgi:hypothetical protein